MEAIQRAEGRPPVVDGDVGEDGGLRGQGAGATRPGQITGETHGMAGVVVAPRLMAGEVEELQDGQRPHCKGRGEGGERGVLGAPVNAELRQGKAPR